MKKSKALEIAQKRAKKQKGDVLVVRDRYYNSGCYVIDKAGYTILSDADKDAIVEVVKGGKKK